MTEQEEKDLREKYPNFEDRISTDYENLTVEKLESFLKELSKPIKDEQSFYDPLNFDYDEFEKLNK